MNRRRVSVVSGSHSRRGFVLIVVMVVVAMVGFAGFAFVNTMSDEYRAVKTHGDSLEAEQTLASAETLLLHLLDQPEPVITEAGGLEDNPALFRQQLLVPPVGDTEQEVDPVAWRFSVISPRRGAATDGAMSLAEDATSFRFGLENESARLNLSHLLALDAQSPEKSREVLMGLPGMTPAAADGLLDWLDADDVAREFGAEAAEYRDLSVSYSPRNGLPHELEELLLVPEVTKVRLFGLDINSDFRIEPHEFALQEQLEAAGTPSAEDVETELQGVGWADFLTLRSAERNVDSFGRPRINLNQSDDAALREQLTPEFAAPVVEYILQYRQQARTTRGPGIAASGSGGSEQLLIPSVADLIDGGLSTAASPINPASREVLTQLLDRTTTDSRSVIPGRINVNLALRPVLRAIPGLDDDTITQILTRRAALDPEMLRTPAWLLTEQILSLETFRQVLPHVTTGGDVYRAQIVAWRLAGGPQRRIELILDRAQGPARRLLWKDLSVFGTGAPISQLSLLGEDGNAPPPLNTY